MIAVFRMKDGSKMNPERSLSMSHILSTSGMILPYPDQSTYTVHQRAAVFLITRAINLHLCILPQDRENRVESSATLR